MSTVLLWTMAVTAFIVTITGGVLLAVLLFYGMFRLFFSFGSALLRWRETPKNI